MKATQEHVDLLNQLGFPVTLQSLQYGRITDSTTEPTLRVERTYRGLADRECLKFTVTHQRNAEPSRWARKHGEKQAIPPFFVFLDAPRWRQSIMKWITAAQFRTMEWNAEEQAKASEKARIQARMRESLSALLRGSGVTPEELESIARVEFNSNREDLPVEDAYLIRMAPWMQQKPETMPQRIARLCRLYYFLKVEGWFSNQQT